MSDLAVSSVAVDLSRLPAPPVVQPLDYAACMATILADFHARCAAAGYDYDLILESDPAMKLLEELAYRVMLGRAEINDAAKALMLAFARRGDLDHLAAQFQIARRIIAPATDDADAVMEGDEELRARVQLAPEMFPIAGRTSGGYRGIALAAAGSVKDVAPVKREGGRIDVILLGRAGDGTVDDETVQRVYVALQADDATQLTDIVTVSGATIVTYAPTITVQIRPGPDPLVVKAAAELAVRAYAADRHRIGMPVYRQMLAAAAAVGSVEQAIVDIDDVEIGPRQAAYMSALTVNVEVME